MFSIRSTLFSAAVLAMVGSSSQAAIISNPGFQFVTGGHANGDSGGHAVNLNTTNTPSWKPATTSGGFAPNITDPQGIFANNPNEYLQVQIHNSNGGSMDAIQVITIPATDHYKLSMDADRRSDNVNTNGTMILQLWSGNVSSFTSGSPITPDAQVSPALTGSFQQFSRTYNSLAAGTYTVRVGGTYTGPSTFFQAGIDNVDMVVVVPVPEPSTIGLVGLGISALVMLRRRK